MQQSFGSSVLPNYRAHSATECPVSVSELYIEAKPLGMDGALRSQTPRLRRPLRILPAHFRHHQRPLRHRLCPHRRSNLRRPDRATHFRHLPPHRCRHRPASA